MYLRASPCDSQPLERLLCGGVFPERRGSIGPTAALFIPGVPDGFPPPRHRPEKRRRSSTPVVIPLAACDVLFLRPFCSPRRTAVGKDPRIPARARSADIPHLTSPVFFNLMERSFFPRRFEKKRAGTQTFKSFCLALVVLP